MPSSAIVATLIADPAALRLSDARIARLAQGLGGFDSWRWLDEGVAADLVFTAPLGAVRAALAAAGRHDEGASFNVLHRRRVPTASQMHVLQRTTCSALRVVQRGKKIRR